MNSPDLINGAFELWGGVMLWVNVKALWRDKRVLGISISTPAFFFVWGLWNLFYYPHLEQWASLVGAVFIVSANITWVMLALHYRKNGAQDVPV